MFFLNNGRSVGSIFVALAVTACAPGFGYAAEQMPSSAFCPSEDFQIFFKEFSSNVTAQRTLSANRIKLTQLDSSNDGVSPSSKIISAADLAFPVIAPFAKGQSAFEITVAEGKAEVVDMRAGLDAIKVYSFSKGNCWALAEVEDWSVKDKDLHLVHKPGLTTGQEACFNKGDIFARLAGPEQYPLTKEFYEAAEQNYVCAAASGDPEASYAAASLSMSQMSPFLGYAHTEKLYQAAAKSIPEAALVLSSFYCDGGDSSAPDGPCKDPAKAIDALIQAAKLGSTEALNALGESFEKGRLDRVDAQRAYACYEAAAAKGDDDAKVAMHRLATIATAFLKNTKCY